METLTINIPDNKSDLVKQVLKDLGVTIEQEPKKKSLSEYKKRILNIPIWSDEDLKPIEEAREAFNNIKPPKW